MENFQLYRTNLLLGGQMKWDLVIENNNNCLNITDFHLSPISNNIPYTYQSDENLLNFNHQDNIKNYYKKLQGQFYSEGLDEQFNTNWPTIVKPNEKIATYSNIYDMGCKRIKYYTQYNKQFEFFCPVWIEKLTDSLMFKITIKGDTSNSVLATHSLTITKPTGKKTHDKFVKYFKQYINAVKLNSGDENLIHLKFKTPQSSYVAGIDCKTGLNILKPISNTVNDMTSRERPMLEIDNMLMNCFKNNSMICKQLFNFNICFNLDDIMSSTTAKFLKGKALTVTVDVYIDGKELPKRDFYCNYNFIPREKYYDETSALPIDELEKYKANYPGVFEPLNVFDHLHDNMALDLVMTNKYCPKVCHWCLNDNTSYMFNIYRGFDGYSIGIEKDKPVIIENEHHYGKIPNTTVKAYSLALNNCGWFNYEDITAWNQFYKYILNTDKYKKELPVYLNGQRYVNGLKYDYVPEDTYLLGVKTTNRVFTAISNTYINEIDWLSKTDRIGLMVKDNLILLITTNYDNLTFASLYSLLTDLSRDNWITEYDVKGNVLDKVREAYIPHITNLYKMLCSVVSPDIIVLGGNINWTTAAGPTKSIKEVVYYKDSTIDYVFRYDGNLKPYFIENEDLLYYKDCISDSKEASKLSNSKYAQYEASGYDPVYPSIGYCSCKLLTDYSRDTLPLVFTSEYNWAPMMPTYEYSWFNNGKSIYILPELNFTYVNKKRDDNTYKELPEIVVELVRDYYNADGETLDFIMSKYEYTNHWEYFSDMNVDDYTYTIKLKLK